ncbi:TPA: haloacid dehalogenase-like hydrolase [Legionella pneumophila]|nr:haloacid dehalogenase-like hydrolase [Legionella pneumophila]
MQVELGGERFAKEIVDQIDKSCSGSLGASTPYAAIDADGTIWKWDIGIRFFEFQLEHGLIKNDYSRAKFLKCKRNNPAIAFAELASINAGKYPEELDSEIQSFLREQQVLVFASTIELIETLLSRGIKVIVVSASIDRLVSLALSEINLNLEVIGMESIVGPNGLLTEDVRMPLPFGSGKRLRLLERFSAEPIFAMGNTVGDATMIESAQFIKLAVASIDDDRDIDSRVLYEKEQALREYAIRHGWLHHQF